MDREEQYIDFEENCAACGVNDRKGGSRYCRSCHEALIEA